MTAPTFGVRSWAAVEMDPERALTEFARWFPGVPTWFGEYTGQWFALLRRPGGDQLVEADTPENLARRLNAAGARPRRRMPDRSAGMPGDGGTAAGVQWSPPPHSPRRAGSERPGPTKRSPRGRHEAKRRRGWLRRLLDWLTRTEER